MLSDKNKRNKKIHNRAEKETTNLLPRFEAKDYFLIFIWYFLTPTGRRKDERKMEFDIFLLTNTHSHTHTRLEMLVDRSSDGWLSFMGAESIKL